MMETETCWASKGRDVVSLGRSLTGVDDAESVALGKHIDACAFRPEWCVAAWPFLIPFLGCKRPNPRDADGPHMCG